MISTHLREYAQEKFDKRRKQLTPVMGEIEAGLHNCTADEAVLMKFLYGTMPVRDAGEYEFQVFLSYVRHSLFLREHVEWCAELPEDMFVHYVLYYRINSEDICDSRAFFYEKLKDRIAGLPLEKAVLEINYWCAENAAYEAADARTINPMTVYLSGKGRCGEESTFAVNAFRSVGIAARQVYTPRWAHCDDNHAWVEVCIHGKWHFLGACEPEEVLDKGWFSNASSRALLVHSRTFSDYAEETCQECIGKEDLLIYYNSTSTYARTRLFTICVKDREGQPVKEARVLVEILNMAEWCDVTTLYTDELGEAQITLGLGDVRLRAVSDMWFAEETVSVKENDGAVLVLDQAMDGAWIRDEWENLEVEAPEDYAMHPVKLSADQKQTRRRRLAEANRLRDERMESYYREEAAAAYPEEAGILRQARGNFEEVYSFLAADDNPDRKAMLHSLSVKDYKDLKADVLETHLDSSRGSWPEEIYREYILCPRIYFEELTAYRPFIQAYFSQEQKEAFGKCPEKIWEYIQENIDYDPESDYKTIYATPVGCLKMKQGNPISCKILFVAICRTLGIPARLNKVTIQPEYDSGEGFVQPGMCGETCPDNRAVCAGTAGCSVMAAVNSEAAEEAAAAETAVEGTAAEEAAVAEATAEEAAAEEATAAETAAAECTTEAAGTVEPGAVGESGVEDAELLLEVEDGGKWNYYQNWTVGKLTDGSFQSLDYEGIRFEGNALVLKLSPGIYRLITSSRMPNGSQHAAQRIFALGKGEQKQISMTLREGSLEDMLVHNELADFELTDKKGGLISLSQIVDGQDAVLAFLEEGAEPTEHVLNELILAADDWNSLNVGIIMVVRDNTALENATLGRALGMLKGARIYYDPEGENAEPVARRMYVDPEKLPLLTVLKEGLNGIYACSGYNVGSVELMRKILLR